MPLILAIEPDRRQAAQLQAVVKRRLDAELILVETTERALDAIGNRMPDLVLVPALLSPQDDAALAAALRVIAAAAHVQMLTIPVLGSAKPERKAGGVLSALRRGKQKPAAAETDGCDPGMFAEQIASYLERAEEERPGGAAAEAEWAAASSPREVPQTQKTQDDDEATPQAEPASDPWRTDSIAAFREFAVTAEREPEPVAMEPLTFESTEPEPMPLEAAGPEPEVFEPVEPEMVEPPAASGTDESVSLALEEAVRALFSGPGEPPSEDLTEDVAPSVNGQDSAAIDEQAESIDAAAGDEESTFADEAEDDQYDEVALASQLSVQPVQRLDEELFTDPSPANAVEQDEWAALEELIAALDAMPLAAVQATADDEWIAPVSDEAEPPAQPVEVEAEAEAEDEPEPVLAAAPAAAPPAAARSEREWVALIESLRHDVERLRSERAEKPAKKSATPKAARAESARAEAAPAEAARPVAARTDAARADSKTRPIQDEWGFFDPEQCGFAALLSKLDEVTDADETRGPADQPRRNK